MFNDPKFDWSAQVYGVIVTGDTMIDPGATVDLSVATMCGKETANCQISPTERMSVKEAARRAQFAASIQHVTRRACEQCRDQYQHGTNSHEKQFLWSEYPELGPIVGLDTTGPFGAPVAPIVPEELGSTDDSELDGFRRGVADNRAAMREQIERFRNKSGKT